MKKSLIAALIAGAALVPSTIQAQSAAAEKAASTAAPATATAQIAVGAKVFGKDGAEIGAVEKVDGDMVVITVGTSRATVPAKSIAATENGLQFSMTKAELEAAVNAGAQKANAALDAALVASAPVLSKDGQSIGTVQKVEGDNVTLDITSGSPVALAKSFFALDAAGALQITLTASEFQSAASSAAASAGSTAAATTTEEPATGE